MYTVEESGSNVYSRTQSGSHLTGEYSLSSTGTDSYTLTENGQDAGGGFGGVRKGSGVVKTLCHCDSRPPLFPDPLCSPRQNGRTEGGCFSLLR